MHPTGLQKKSMIFQHTHNQSDEKYWIKNIFITFFMSARQSMIVFLTVLCSLRKCKDSNNSSTPPSKDENRPQRTSSLLEKTDRKVGGHAGHEGRTLEMTDHPDEIIEHRVLLVWLGNKQKPINNQIDNQPPVHSGIMVGGVMSNGVKLGVNNLHITTY